jgi:hypothetical protein
MPHSQKVREAVQTARPVVERLAKDDEFQKHVRSAYESARHVYDELFIDDATAKGVARKLARDKDIQDELRTLVAEFRDASKRVKGKQTKSHKARNTMLLAGIVLGILYNPATGPETRQWLKEKVFGPDETFEYEP